MKIKKSGKNILALISVLIITLTIIYFPVPAALAGTYAQVPGEVNKNSCSDDRLNELEVSTRGKTTPEAKLILGNFYLDCGDYKEAQDYYDQAIGSAAPDSKEALAAKYGSIEIEFLSGQIGEAQKDKALEDISSQLRQELGLSRCAPTCTESNITYRGAPRGYYKWAEKCYRC